MSAKDKIKEIVKNNIESEVTPIDLIRSNVDRASKELSDKRYSICQACPELTRLTKQCKKCGCFMQLKVELEKATCPIGKW